MEIVVLVHNIRSILNVGSIFRTSEGFGVKKIYLSGYTPSPNNGLPHVREKLKKQLHKTALGAENIVPHEYTGNINELIKELKEKGFQIVGLEQDKKSIPLHLFARGSDPLANTKIALLIGEEVNGIEQKLRDLCDVLVEIPMFGQKESFNVAVATGIALYELTMDGNE